MLVITKKTIYMGKRELLLEIIANKCFLFDYQSFSKQKKL